MRRVFFVMALSVVALWAGNNQAIIWQKTYGTDTTDIFWGVIPVGDSGYLVSGGTKGRTGGANYDSYILRVLSNGDTVWTHMWGWDAADEQAYSVAFDERRELAVTAGYTYSTGAGLSDVLSQRFSLSGDSLGYAVVGGGGYDIGNDIKVDEDGNYVLVGYTTSYGVRGDFYIVKMDSAGDTIWTRTYGGDSLDIARQVVIDSSGYYYVVGFTYSFGNYVQAWIMKLDPSNGDTVWTKLYGGPGVDAAYSAILSNKTLIVAGYTTSYGAGGHDMWALALNDSTGDTLWTRTYGGVGNDEANSITYLPDGYAVITGFTTSFGSGSYDMLVVIARISDGKAVWYGTYGGSDIDIAYGVTTDDSGKIVIVGKTKSYGSGAEDGYILKIDPDQIEPLALTALYPGVLNRGAERKLQIYGHGFTQYAESELSLNFVDTSGNDVFSIQPDSIVSDNRMIFNVPAGALSAGYYDVYLSVRGIVYTDTLLKSVFVAELDTTHKWWKKDSIANIGDDVRYMAEGDADNDGQVELYATSYNNKVYKIWYDGIWHTDEIYSATVDARYIAIGDADYDGKNEMYVSIGNGSTKGYLLRFDYNGTSWNVDTLYSTGNNFNGIDIGDIDNDGQREVCTVSGKGKFYVFKYNGTSYDVDSLSLPYGRVHDVKIGDVDNDGKNEAYIGTGNLSDWDDARLVKVYYSGGVLTSNVIVHKYWPYAGGFISLAIGDIDNDGQLELYSSLNIPNELLVYKYNGTSWNEYFRLVESGDFRQIQVLDLDNDGKNEVYVPNNHGEVVYGAPDLMHRAYIRLENAYAIALSYADMDKDGKLEIYAGTSTGTIYRITRADYPAPVKGLEIYRINQDNVNIGKRLNNVYIYGRGFSSDVTVKFVNTQSGTQVNTSLYNYTYGELTIDSDTFPEPGYYDLIVSGSNGTDTLRNALLVNNLYHYYYDEGGFYRFYQLDSISDHIRAAVLCDLDEDGTSEIYIGGNHLYKLNVYSLDSFEVLDILNVPGIIRGLYYGHDIDGSMCLYAASDDHNVYKVKYSGGTYSYSRVNFPDLSQIDYAGAVNSTLAYDFTGNGLLDIFAGRSNGKIDIWEMGPDGYVMTEYHRRLYSGSGASITGLGFLDMLGPRTTPALFITGGSSDSAAVVKRCTLQYGELRFDNIYTSSYHGYVYLRSILFKNSLAISDYHSLKEVYYSGSWYDSNEIIAGERPFTSMVEGDLDNDGKMEIWAADSLGFIYEVAWNGPGDYYIVDSVKMNDDNGPVALLKGDLDKDGKIEVYGFMSNGKVFRVEKKPLQEIHITRVSSSVINHNNTSHIINIYGSGFNFYWINGLMLNVDILQNGNKIMTIDNILWNPDNWLQINLDGTMLPPGRYDIQVTYKRAFSNVLKGALVVNEPYTERMWYEVDTANKPVNYGSEAEDIVFGNVGNDYFDFIGLSNGAVISNGDTIYLAQDSIHDLEAADIDGDGSCEVFVATGYNNERGALYELRYNGGAWLADTMLLYNKDINAVSAVDINNDGINEVLAGTEGGWLFIFTRNDTLWLKDSVDLTAFMNIYGIDGGDAQGYTKVRAYITTGTDTTETGYGAVLSLYKVQDSFIIDTIASGEEDVNYKYIIVTDASGDGDEEIYVTGTKYEEGNYHFTVSKIYYRYTGTFWWEEDVLMREINPFGRLIAGDLNNDGKAEVFVAGGRFIYSINVENGDITTFNVASRVKALSYMFYPTMDKLFVFTIPDDGKIWFIWEKEIAHQKPFEVYEVSNKSVAFGDTFFLQIIGRNLDGIEGVWIFNNATGTVIKGSIKEIDLNRRIMVEFIDTLCDPGYYNLVLSSSDYIDTVWGAVILHKTFSTSDSAHLYYSKSLVTDLEDTFTAYPVIRDLDKDGYFELYVASDSLYQIKWQEGRYVKRGLVEIPGGAVSLGAGDIDNNGTQELFVVNGKEDIFKIYKVGAMWHMDTAFLTASETYNLAKDAIISDMDGDGANGILISLNASENKDVYHYEMIENHGGWRANSVYEGTLPVSGIVNRVERGIIAIHDCNYLNLFMGVGTSEGIHVYKVDLSPGYHAVDILSVLNGQDNVMLLKALPYPYGNSNGRLFVGDSLLGNLYMVTYDSNDLIGHTDDGYFTDVVVGDLDNMAEPKIFASSSDGKVYSFTQITPDSFIQRAVFDLGEPIVSLIEGDINRDNYIEMYATTYDGKVYVIQTEVDTLAPDKVEILNPHNGDWINADSVKIEWNHVSKLNNTHQPGGFVSLKSLKTSHNNIFRKLVDDREFNYKSPVFYRVEISEDSAFSSLLVDTFSLDTTFIFTPSSDGKFYIRVRAEDSVGNTSDYSQVVTFGVDRGLPWVDSLTILQDTSIRGPFEVKVYPADSLSGIGNVRFYYRRMEDTGFVGMDAVFSDGAYSGFIPEVNIAYDTVHYYVVIYDVAGNAKSSPENAPSVTYEFTAGATGIEEHHKRNAFDFRIPSVSTYTITLSMYLPQRSDVYLGIFDVDGRKVKTVYNGLLEKGLHRATVKNLAKGVYLYILKYEDKTFKGKVVITGR